MIRVCQSCGGRVWMSEPPLTPAPGLWLETVDAVAMDPRSVERLADVATSGSPVQLRPGRAKLWVIEGGGEK